MAAMFEVQNIYESPQISRKRQQQAATPHQPRRRMTLFDLRYPEACCYVDLCFIGACSPDEDRGPVEDRVLRIFFR